MFKNLVLALVIVTSSVTLLWAAPTAKIETSAGDIVIELNADKAPISVQNFIDYAKSGFYNGTIFHRVIDGFMIQGGGLEPGMKTKVTNAPIKNEAINGLKNKRGTIVMARSAAIDSATSQFFINVADNGFLDHQNMTPGGYGYAVFGTVIKGMDVVDKIKSVRTTNKAMYQDVPADDIVIQKVTVNTSK